MGFLEGMDGFGLPLRLMRQAEVHLLHLPMLTSVPAESMTDAPVIGAKWVYPTTLTALGTTIATAATATATTRLTQGVGASAQWVRLPRVAAARALTTGFTCTSRLSLRVSVALGWAVLVGRLSALAWS